MKKTKASKGKPAPFGKAPPMPGKKALEQTPGAKAAKIKGKK